MSIGIGRWCAALALGLGLLFILVWPTARGDEPDLLPDAKARLAIEAQRVEKEFTENRAAAYKLMRAATPNYIEAVARLRTVLAILEADTSVAAPRRETLIATIKWDLDKARELAGDRRRTSLPAEEPIRPIRPDVRPGTRPGQDQKGTVSEVDRIISGRNKGIGEASSTRRDGNDRRLATMKGVDESALPEPGNYRLPANWAELSKRRTTNKLTAKEKELMAALSKTISVEFAEASFQEVIETLERLTGQAILVDKQGTTDAGVTYEGTKVNLKLKSSSRWVLKRVLADLNLAYYVKDEQIHITSVARAREETSIRTYYMGDLFQATNLRQPAILNQLQMQETINRVINQITQTIEPQSWKVNNAEAPGTIAFDPVTMSLVIKQTSEFHLRMGGGDR